MAEDEFPGHGEAVESRPAPEQARGHLAAEHGEGMVPEPGILEAVFAALPDPVFVVTRAGTFSHVNPAAARLFGLEPAEMIGKPRSQLGPSASLLDLCDAQREAMLAAGLPTSGKIDLPTSSGARTCEFTLSPLKREGQAVAITLRSVAERGRPESEHERLGEELREANEKLVFANLEAMAQAERAESQTAQMHALLASLRDGVAIFDGAGRLLLRNEAAQELTVLPDHGADHGADREERAGAADGQLRLLDVEGRPMPVEQWPAMRVLRGEDLRDFEGIVERPDGSRRYVVHNSGTVRNRDGKVELAILVLRDVTELRRLEQAREEFTSLVSHDLRSPLATVRGHAQLLQHLLGRQGLRREAASAEAILKSADRMNWMIRSLVESTRLESGRLELRGEPTEVTPFLAELLGRVGSPADQARITLEAPDWVPLVLIDPEWLERAVTNLVTNALKYSPPESPVVVRVERRDAEVVISVADRGAGIPAEELPHLFEKFRRVRATGQADGLGLGLYIARMVVEAHGGRIWAESQAGKGSTFSLALPINPG